MDQYKANTIDRHPEPPRSEPLPCFPLLTLVLKGTQHLCFRVSQYGDAVCLKLGGNGMWPSLLLHLVTQAQRWTVYLGEELASVMNPLHRHIDLPG